MHGRVSGERRGKRGGGGREEERCSTERGCCINILWGRFISFRVPDHAALPANEFRWLHYQDMVGLSAVAAGLHFHKKEQLAPLCIGSEIKPVETY